MPDFGNASVYSQTDASNNTGTNPGWPEGMAPSRVNDAARALQGATKRFRDYRSYTVTSGGSAAVQTLTYSVAPDLQTGDEFCFIAGFTVTGAHTLNINAIGALSVKKVVAGALTDPVANDWLVGDKVTVSYDGTYLVAVHVGVVATSFAGGTLTVSTLMSGKDFREAKGAAVASAGTTDIWTPADGNYVHITGTTTITSLGTAHQAGETRTVIFDGALTLTHNATSLILPGAANITTAANDRMIVRADTTANIIVIDYVKASGQPVVTQSLGVTEYDKGAYTVSTKYTQAHGLGSTAAVKLVKVFLECTTIDASYAVGDRIEVANGASTGGAPVFTVMHNATNVIVNCGSVIGVASNAATPVGATGLTAASWKVIIKVYA